MKRKILIAVVAAITVIASLLAITVISASADTPAPTLSIKSNTLELKNAVFMNFKVLAENVEDTSDVSLLVWHEAPEKYEKGTENAVLSSIRTEDDTGYLVFQYNDLAAKDMTKIIYVCAYVEADGEGYYSNPVKFSIYQYAYNILTSSSQSEELKALVLSMLDYGAKAQVHFNHNTDFLANAAIAKVKVVNGTHADGMKTGYFSEGTQITVTANEPEEGYVFSHWEDSSGKTVGTEATLVIESCVSETYTAVMKVKTETVDGLIYTLLDDGTYEVSGIEATDTTELVIPAKVNNKDVTKIGDQAFRNCTSLTSVTIPAGVTSIGEYAFSGCTSLADIVIPDSVTSIGGHAFARCSNLKRVNISDIAAWCNIDFLPSYVGEVYFPQHTNPLGQGALLYLDGELVTNLVIPNDVQKVKKYAFYGCESLISVTFENGVSGIGEYSFSACERLASITLPDSITYIHGSAFIGCSGMQKVNISSLSAWLNIELDQTKINNSSSSGSDSKTPLDQGAGLYIDGELVTDIVIPEGIKNIPSYSFYGYDSLKSVTISDSVTSIGDFAFYGCTSLTSITIPQNITNVGTDVFGYCLQIQHIYISDISAWITGDSYGIPANSGAKLYLDGELVTDLVIPEGVEFIGVSAFNGIHSITSVTIPSSVKNIDDYAFANCSNLESVTIGKGVETIGVNPFANCNKLETITVDKDNSFYHVAGNCLIETKTKTLVGGCNTSVIPTDGSVTSIAESAFDYCTELESIVIPDSVESIGYKAFYRCSALTNITIGKGVTYIDDNAFDSCKRLNDVYYRGTEEEWLTNVVIRSGNDYLISATIHYNYQG